MVVANRILLSRGSHLYLVSSANSLSRFAYPPINCFDHNWFLFDDSLTLPRQQWQDCFHSHVN